MNPSVYVSLLWLVICAGLAAVIFFPASFILSLPLRRQERSRFFLDLLETGLRAGHSPEQTIVGAAQARDRSPGVGFHLLAAYIESGLTLAQAGERVSGLLPPQLLAMIAAGCATGRLDVILPACRRRLRDGPAQSLKAQNYVMLLVLIISPVWIVIVSLLEIYVFPQLKFLTGDMEVQLSGILPWLTAHRVALIASQALLLAVFYGGAALYLGGARLERWIGAVAPGLVPGLTIALPWKRKRMQRDFSATLAALLDAGTSESQAITLAAETAANQVFRRQAEVAVADLRGGARLSQALQRLDASGEFRWRLANAAEGPGGFLAALGGWHEALDAQAFQQEQAAAQLISTGLIIFNGVLVAVVVVGVFQVLISIIEAGVLW